MAESGRLQELLDEQAGTIVRSQVPADQWPHVRWLLHKERWQRVHPGMFVSHSGPITREQWRWLGVLGGGKGAALCGPTAAELAGLKGLESRVVHICIPFGRRGPAVPGLRYHRSREYEREVAPNREPRRIALPYALLAMAGAAPTELRAHEVLTAAAQQSLIRTADLRDVIAAKPNMHRRALITETLVDIDDGAQSMNEIAMLRLLQHHGLPRPELQVVAATPRRRSRIDGGWPDYAVCFEIDGAGHMQIAKWIDDADRHNEVALSRPQGTTLLRWPGFVVRHHQENVADQVRRALRRGGWQGPCTP